MKHLVLILAIALSAGAEVMAQQKTGSHFMQVTTVESVVGGGFGRSKMIITKEDGSQEEKDLDNLFSLTGINFKNIKGNENTILQTLKSYTDAGWKLMTVIPLTLSPNDKSGAGIFMTRYLLTKEEAEK
jgi:hypothetical protein